MSLSLQFFDQPVAIESDSAHFLRVMDAMYHHFETSPSVPASTPPLQASYCTGDASGHASLLLDGNQEWLEAGEVGEGFAYEQILYSAVSRVRSHFLAHAGAVAYDGRGVILAADAANGKTTLVLELLRRGWNFLSDEMAALSFSDGRLHTFPRALRLRDDTLARVGLPLAAGRSLRWGDKTVIDVDDLLPGRRVLSAQITHVVVLSDAGPWPVDNDWLSIRIHHSTPVFMDRLQALPGVLSLKVEGGGPYPMFRLRTQQRMPTLNAIESVCREEGIQLMDVIKRPEVPAAFSGPARLEPLTHSQAALELLRRFQGGHHAWLLEQTYGGQTTRLYQAVARLIAGAQCHHLIVGDRLATADLVDALGRSNA